MVKPIPRDHQGFYLSVPFTHGRQSNISEEKEEERKMINGFVRREEFHKLTEPEAKAFILFLIMEAERHREDIRVIEEDIIYVRRTLAKEEGRKNG